MRKLQELSLTLENIYPNYGFDYEEPLLKYVAIVAGKYKPLTPGDVESSHNVSTAITTFAQRYLQGKVDKISVLPEYLNDKSLPDSIEAMGYDVNEFWYLLMFIYDYSLGFSVKGFNKNEAPKKQISKLINAIIENISAANNDTGEVIFYKPAKIVLEIDGRPKITVDDSFVVGWLAAICFNELIEIEAGSKMTTSITQLKINNGRFENDPLPGTVHISYFVKMFLSFFELKPPVKGVQKKGSLIFYNKNLLISKLIYLTKLSKNESFNTSDKNLKGFKKQSKDIETYRYNGLYF